MLDNLNNEKRTIAVIGFLGRGNCGDEALFQCIYEAFCDEFNIIVCVDDVGAYEGWQNWYPYSECLLVHQGNIHFFEKPIAGLIVGGGGLGLGYGAAQALVARGAGTPVVLAGTDSTALDRPQRRYFDDATLRYIKLFDYVSLRNEWSVKCARIAGADVNYGADWAFRLQADPSTDRDRQEDRVLVTFREWAADTFDKAFYISETRRLLEAIVEAGLKPAFLPFAPEDENFLKYLGIEDLAPVERHWWNPRRVKQIIKDSAMLISVGRLHPMIFAASASVPSIQIAPPLRGVYEGNSYTKMRIMADEFKVPFLTIDEACDAIQSGTVTFSDETKAAVSQTNERLDAMIGDIKAVFSVDVATDNSRLVADLRLMRDNGLFADAKHNYDVVFSRVGYLPTHIIDYIGLCADAKDMQGVEQAILDFTAGHGGPQFLDEPHRTAFRGYADRHGLTSVQALFSEQP